MTDIDFVRVIPTEDQVKELYTLLLHREHRISHKYLPSIDEHFSFVNSHPYRAWYIIYLGKQAIGSFYVSNENTIGINFLEYYDVNNISEIIAFVKYNFSPLPGINSVRCEDFAINVSPSDKTLLESLNKIGAKVLQITYSLK